MLASGLRARAVNRDTVQLAQKDNMNLYKEILTGATIVLVSPEQLLSQRFEVAISDKDFAKRVCMMAIDEVHLLNTWGKSFRKLYLQVGWARARLKNAVPLIATTATLQGGKNTEDICTFLGLQRNLHVIRRSNIRRDFRIIFRTMSSNPESSDAFPELDWVLSSRRKVLIHHWSIATCWRIGTYLIKKDASNPYRTIRIRIFHALNWPSHNDDTLRKWKEGDPNVQVIVATAIFAVGMDALDFEDVIVLGEPSSADMWWQVLGRIRPRQAASMPRGICYVTPNAVSVAKKVLEEASALGMPQSTQKPGRMDQSMARIILAGCKVDALNELYENPQDETSCTCSTCTVSALRQQPTNNTGPWTCNCSGCQPEPPEHANVPVIPHELMKKQGRKHLTKLMRAHGMKELYAWRDKTWRTLDRNLQWVAPNIFFPDWKMKELLDGISKIVSLDILVQFIRDVQWLVHKQVGLYVAIKSLQQDFENMRIARNIELRECRKTRRSELVILNDLPPSGESESEGSGPDDEDETDGDQQASIRWRINIRYVIEQNVIVDKF